MQKNMDPETPRPKKAERKTIPLSVLEKQFQMIWIVFLWDVIPNDLQFPILSF